MTKSRLFIQIMSSVLVITHFTHASEYIISDYDNSNKEQVYKIVSKYRFPSILSKFTQEEFKNRYKLSLIETFGTKEKEHKFLQSEITKIAPKAKICAIPKSLYQLIVYDYFAETIKSNGTISESADKFKLDKYAKENEEWGLTKACQNFMNNAEIQNIFYKINDHAYTIYQKKTKAV